MENYQTQYKGKRSQWHSNKRTKKGGHEIAADETEVLLSRKKRMEVGKVSKWTKTNGTKCFCFAERQEFERPWIIVLAAILLTAATGTEYLVNASYYSLTPNFIIFFFIALWWTTIPLKANEAVIEMAVHELMDEVVESDAKVVGTEVVKSFVHYDVKGTYAIITARCFLVLLKNGIVWEYPITYNKPTNENEGYYECKQSYVVSKNQEHIRAIKPKQWSRFFAIFKISDKTRLWLLIFAIILIGGLTFAGTYWLIIRLKWWTIVLIGGYFALYETVERISRVNCGRVINAVMKVVSLPIVLVCYLAALIHPFITIVGTYFFVTLFTFGVPAIILTVVSKVEGIELKPETIAFVVIALGSMLSSHHSITKGIIRHTPLKNWGNHTYELHREQLAFYLVHPSNMVFIIYLIYFVILAVSGYMLIQDGEYLISESFDLAMLKAFLVYIAYTNMRTKAKDTEVEAKELLGRISGLFVHDKYE